VNLCSLWNSKRVEQEIVNELIGPKIIIKERKEKEKEKEKENGKIAICARNNDEEKSCS